MLKQKRSPCLINIGLQQLYLGMSGYFVSALPSRPTLTSMDTSPLCRRAGLVFCSSSDQMTLNQQFADCLSSKTKATEIAAEEAH